MNGTCSRVALRALGVAAILGASLAQALPTEVKVLTRNVYLGADLAPVIEAIQAGDPLAVPPIVAATYAKVENSKPIERMARIADEILTHRPHVVGLQELVLWQTRTPSALIDPTAPLISTFDFYRDLNTALGGSLSPYTLVTGLGAVPVSGVGIGPNLPVLTDVVLTDASGILVRKDIPVLAFGSDYFTNITVIPGLGLPILRGISYVDVEIGGHKMRVTNSHLDSLDPVVNLAQSQELVDFLDASPFRQIALGDFNSTVEPFDGVFIPTGNDLNMLANGFRDAWLDKGGGAPGFTWRDDELLNDPGVDLFSQRLDYVYHRGGFVTDAVERIGDDPMCGPLDPPGPCWASDHAGVLATLQVVPVPGSLALLALGLFVLGMRSRLATGTRTSLAPSA